MEKVRRSCGFLNGIEVSAEGSKGGLCLAWKENVSIILESYSRNHIDVSIQTDMNKKWLFTGFYGTSIVKNKNEVWNILRNLSLNRNHP